MLAATRSILGKAMVATLTVTEKVRRLEPVTPDPFIAALEPLGNERSSEPSTPLRLIAAGSEQGA
jgi:hypothetical protein